MIRPVLPDEINIRNAGWKPVSVVGDINLVFQISNVSVEVPFYVLEGLATSVILGCDYCNTHVEAIRPRKRII